MPISPGSKHDFADCDAADQFGGGDGMGYTGHVCPDCRTGRTHHIHDGWLDGRHYNAYSCGECYASFREYD